MRPYPRLRIAAHLIGWFIPFILLATIANPAPRADQSKAKKKKPVVPAASAKEGQGLFGKNCVVCHGANGIGDEGPNLHKLALSGTGISFTIRNGRKNEMPAFAGKLKDVQIASIVAYLRTLK